MEHTAGVLSCDELELYNDFEKCHLEKVIKQCNIEIKCNPYSALPHYKKRTALSMLDNIPNPDLKYDNSIYFVISTIATVPEHEFSGDSSDEEIDEEFNQYKNSIDKGVFPFTTSFKKTTILRPEIREAEKSSYLNQCRDSTVVDKFLSKLLANGFEKPEESSTVAVSIGLNRMDSLSTRKNNSLTLELESNVNTKIKYETFGFYWTCQWYSKDGRKANIKTVRSFYKKLKVYNPDSAKKFIAQEQIAETNVPYQYIREYAKNHAKTKQLIQEFRNINSDATIYLHIVDADVYDFNGVYSAYLRIIRDCLNTFMSTPTVISTGYEFPEDPQHKSFKVLSHLDRMIRVTTTLYIPLGTYYPEPNMCILIPQNCDTVEESFIDRKRGKTLESPILLANILNNRRNVRAIFSEDKPIITAIPSRAKVNKKKKSINFSPECSQGPAAPTRDDIKKYAQVSQSHSDHFTWSKSLFINNAIKYDNLYETDGECLYDRNNRPLKGVDKQCIKLIGNIRNNVDVNLSKSKLANRIGGINAQNIVDAIEALKEYDKIFYKAYERTEEEKDLIDIIRKCGIDLMALSTECLLTIVNSPIMDSIKDNVIDLAVLIKLDQKMLEYILYDNGIIQALHNKDINLNNLIACLEDDFEDFVDASTEYDVRDILRYYNKNPLCLKFKAGNPIEIVYVNSDDLGIVEYAIKHELIDEDDIRWIKDELRGDRDESASEMDFTRILDEARSNIKKPKSDDQSYQHSDSEMYWD